MGKKSSMFHKTKTISISGKGGAGKTTFTILLLKYLIENGLAKDILLVDADPDANLSDMLGLPLQKTVGDICELKSLELQGEAQKETGFRQAVWDAVLQGEGFDLLVMGRTKGKGCYCTVNSYLTKITESILKLYDVVIIDFDAGLEHLSRQSDRLADILLVVTDPSKMGFETAKRIEGLTQELAFDFRKRFLVGSKFTPNNRQIFLQKAEEIGLEPAGAIPHYDAIAESNLLGGSLLNMAWDDTLQSAAAEIWKKIDAVFDVPQTVPEV